MVNKVLQTIKELSELDEEELREAYAVGFDVRAHAYSDGVTEKRAELLMAIVSRIMQLQELPD